MSQFTTSHDEDSGTAAKAGAAAIATTESAAAKKVVAMRIGCRPFFSSPAELRATG